MSIYKSSQIIEVAGPFSIAMLNDLKPRINQLLVHQLSLGGGHLRTMAPSGSKRGFSWFPSRKKPWEYDGICRTYSQPKSI